MPSKHAVLSPSSSKRWLACPPSARLEELMPNKETAYTREGTLAHALGEFFLRHRAEHPGQRFSDTIVEETKEVYLKRPQVMKSALKEIIGDICTEGLDPWEMLQTVMDGYVRPVEEDFNTDYAEDHNAILLVEAELKLSEYIPEGFGSSDSIRISGNTMVVNDLKYGKGVEVSAEQNSQMLCYALGALLGPGELYDIDTVVMNIFQPRLNHISTWKISAEGLLSWARVILRPGAQKAFAGEGETVPGEHCKFCRAASRCRTLRNSVLEASWAKPALDNAENLAAAHLMSMEEVGAALQHAGTVRTWLDSIEAFALQEALEGRVVPGYKLVEGRSNRKITDQTAAKVAIAAAGLNPEDYCKPQELETITKLEKLMGKGPFQSILGPLVVKPKGKPTLAPDTDPRAAYAPEASEDFKDIQV